jgi:meckelin
MWLVFFWWYLDWGSQTNSVPSINQGIQSPDNYVLRHFLGTFILLCAGLGHIIFHKMFEFWIPLKKNEFIDLCAISNISLFILDQSLHGYYIHGRSPAGKADSNLDELLSFLEEEGGGRAKGRGFIEKDPVELQTYEIFASYKMRTIYDGMYGLQNEAFIISAANSDRMANQSR